MAPVFTTPPADGGRSPAGAETIVDVFAPRATPEARRARPALFAARLAWAPWLVAAKFGRLDVNGQPVNP